MSDFLSETGYNCPACDGEYVGKAFKKGRRVFFYVDEEVHCADCGYPGKIISNENEDGYWIECDDKQESIEEYKLEAENDE